MIRPAVAALADSPYRIVRRLLLLSKRFGRRDGEAIRVMHDLNLEELSRFAAVAPETIDAMLRDFTDRGWIRHEDGCLVIVDGQGAVAVPARVIIGGELWSND